VIEPKFPKYSKTRAECIAESTESQDGTYIAGHTFGELLAFEDEKTGRWYMIDQCMGCGTPDVLFVEPYSSFVAEAKEYPIVKNIGGPND